MSIQEGLTMRALRRMVRWLAGAYFHLDVRGLGRIPPQGGAIIASNHPSLLDGILLWAVSPRPVRFLVAEEMYRHPVLHPLFRAWRCIEVYRTRSHNGDALHAAVAALERGELIGIFPEGTIHFSGSMRQLKPGVALLALRTGVPVIPLGLVGSREAFPVGAKVPRPRTIQLCFGRPFAVTPVAMERIPEAQVADVLEEVRQGISESVKRHAYRREHLYAIGWGRGLRVACAGLIILPFTRLLTRTARPSLNSVGRAG